MRAGSRQSERGSVTVFSVFAMIALVMISAVAVDVGRAAAIRNGLQITIDSALKAASAKALSQAFALPEAELAAQSEEVAKAYIRSNAPYGSGTVSYDLDDPADFTFIYTPSNDSAPGTNDEDTVSITLNARVEPVLAGMFMPSIPLAVTALVKRPRPEPLELVLALDVTNSMSEALDTGNTKLAELKTAAANLTDFVMQSSEVKVGIVPFTQQVNIGPAFAGKPWLNAQTNTICDVPPCTKTCDPKYWGTCTKGDGTSYGCWVQNCTETCENCRLQTFQGCVPARGKTVNKVFTPSETIANPSNPKYLGQASNCSIPLFTDLTSRADYGGTGATVIKNKINALTVVTSASQGNTFIPIGLIWAWNMLEPTEPLTLASSVTTGPTAPKKVIVLITDGDNYWTPTGPSNGGVAGLSPSTDALTLSTCTNIKADTTNNITIYTVAIGVSSSTTTSMLESCASAPENFFSVESASELQDAFTKISVGFSYNTLVD